MTKTPNYVFDDELYHHGILGQRWRHRRFQNEDGTWTAEGRERYGKDGVKSKTDVQKYKAKVLYKTQKYTADLRAKAQQDKDKRMSKIERNRIKENSKTALLARKEQAKFDRLNKKEEDRLSDKNKVSSVNSLSPFSKTNKTKNMSNDDLQSAIDRLKLQAEYNKQYVLATQPNSALAKADRFFEGETGKAVTQIAVHVLPNVANTIATKTLESGLKYANKEDREKARAETDKINAQTETYNATAELTKQKAINETNESENKIKLDRSKEARAAWDDRQEQKRRNAESENKIENDIQEQNRLNAESENKIKLDRSKETRAAWNDRQEQKRLNSAEKRKDEEQKGYFITAKNGLGGTNQVYVKGSQERANDEAEHRRTLENVKSKYENTKINTQTEQDKLDREQARAFKNGVQLAIANSYKKGEIGIVEAVSKAIENSSTSSIKYSSLSNNKSNTNRASGVIQIASNQELNQLLKDRENNTISDSQRSKIKSMAASGKTIAEIARLLDISETSVIKYK